MFLSLDLRCGRLLHSAVACSWNNRLSKAADQFMASSLPQAKWPRRVAAANQFLTELIQGGIVMSARSSSPPSKISLTYDDVGVNSAGEEDALRQLSTWINQTFHFN